MRFPRYRISLLGQPATCSPIPTGHSGTDSTFTDRLPESQTTSCLDAHTAANGIFRTRVSCFAGLAACNQIGDISGSLAHAHPAALHCSPRLGATYNKPTPLPNYYCHWLYPYTGSYCHHIITASSSPPSSKLAIASFPRNHWLGNSFLCCWLRNGFCTRSRSCQWLSALALRRRDARTIPAIYPECHRDQ